MNPRGPERGPSRSRLPGLAVGSRRDGRRDRRLCPRRARDFARARGPRRSPTGRAMRESGVGRHGSCSAALTLATPAGASRCTASKAIPSAGSTRARRSSGSACRSRRARRRRASAGSAQFRLSALEAFSPRLAELFALRAILACARRSIRWRGRSIRSPLAPRSSRCSIPATEDPS